MQRNRLTIVILALTLACGSRALAASGPVSVSGVVRDSDGVAQLGAVVEVLAGNSSIVGTAFTDIRGRYLISNLVPGRYAVRARAAMLATALRPNVQLRSGARATVNLTLNALFDLSTWLPAERRKADEPPDDWTWTLRSGISRPILRMVDDGSGRAVLVSSSATENRTPVEHARAAVASGGGGFGDGGLRNVFLLDRALADGSDATFRASMGGAAAPLAAAPAVEVQAGYQRRSGFDGADRLVVSYQSHPEMMGAGGAAAYDVMQMASAHRASIGDLVAGEAGGDVYFVRSAGNALASRPFLKITAHPTATWAVDYRMATSRDLQSFAGLDSVELELPVAVMTSGGMQLENGLHQQWGVERKTGRGVVEVDYRRDHMGHAALAGLGRLSASDLAAVEGGALADTATDTFRLMADDVRSQGVDLLVSQPVAANLWLALEYSSGSALAVEAEGAEPTITGLARSLKPRSAQSATVAIHGRILRTGTRARASYRWQPESTVTAVSPFGAFSDQAYLSVAILQSVHGGHLLPPGLEATVDISNLLAEGYRPFLSSDGRTLYLAQMPRAVQAGLAFNF